MNVLKSILIALIAVFIVQLGIAAVALENDSKTYTIDGDAMSKNITSITIPANEESDTIYYTYTMHSGETATASVTVIYTVP